MHHSIQKAARRLACLFAAAIMVVGITASLGAPADAGVITTGSVLQAATTAITQQSSAHVVFVAHATASATTEKIVADVGVTSGSETLSEGKSDLAIRVTPSSAYVRGNVSGLTTLFGLTAAQAKKLGARWESWQSGTKQYGSLKADLTLSSVTALLPKSKGARLSTETTHGAKWYVLKWTTAATSSLPKLSHTLTLPAVGANLPMMETETSTGIKVKTELSEWGEALSVIAPPAASSISSSKITG